MKILFGLNNDDTVKNIVKYYEEMYKEKVEYKNVYYFKQAIQELSQNEYDRLVLLEELEKYPNNNYAQIDEFLFNNIDTMTDEFDAKNIIFVASDRRKLGDAFLARLFNIGVYSVLTGNNRTKSKVCEVISEPKKKKDVKKYYEDTNERTAYGKAQVSEIEIQRIINYYQKQNGVSDKYVEIFDKIAAQYTNEQLAIIIGFLPEQVTTYLAANSEKYNQVLKYTSVVAPEVTEANTTVAQTDSVTNINVERQPQIVEKIVVKQINQQAPVLTQVMEKEVVRSVYEVPKDYKKVVCMIGAPKSGTTFCINGIATMLFRRNIKVAIVDLTKKRDTYTLYTYDNEGKRAIAAESMKYASNGLNEPLVYGKLSVYTGIPGEDRKHYNATNVVQTAMNHNSVVLIDCDFSTPVDYYRLAQEIYIVQDMNVLNVNQITMFLKEIKSRGIPMNKVKIIINKHVRCGLTSKAIIDGIATYSSLDLNMIDPEPLFNTSEMQYYILPFDQENYTKYVEMMYKSNNTFSTFTKDFRTALEQITNAIYPIGITKSEDNTYEKPKRKSLNLFKKAGMAQMKNESSGFEKVVN
ncbi:MAG: hypothetical protein IKV94_03595 [Clostridia bacterium]|nr:hypothetical protein [Clostridia bacterium]